MLVWVCTTLADSVQVPRGEHRGYGFEVEKARPPERRYPVMRGG
jgi:hypothetical protein